MHFSNGNQGNSGYVNNSSKNLNSSQVSDAQNDESFKGNIYFIKFEQFLKEFNSIYMLKIYQKNEDNEEHHPIMNSGIMGLDQNTFKTKKTSQWNCYVFESYWKGKRMGGPKVDLQTTYVSNLKSRFKKGKLINKLTKRREKATTTHAKRKQQKTSQNKKTKQKHTQTKRLR
jgi:hypothetical protein